MVNSPAVSKTCAACAKYAISACRGVHRWTQEACLTAQEASGGKWTKRIDHSGGEVTKITVFTERKSKHDS